MRHAQRARGLGLVLVGVLVGMLLLTPAGAHFTRDPQHLGEHAWHGVIKHRVWTRAQADRRFIRDASGAVGTDTLANRTVTTLKIALGAVGTERLANGAVTTLKIARGAVGTERLGNGAVTNAKIAPRAVGNTKIANRAVSSGKLATGAVTGPKLAPITQVTAETALLATGSSGTVTATCASGPSAATPPPSPRASTRASRWWWTERRCATIRACADRASSATGASRARTDSTPSTS
jgi:hypothetical protein